MIVFKLKTLLQENNITPYEFAKYVETKGLMSAVAVKKFAASDRFPRESSLNTIIAALRAYTGRTIEVSDLLEYLPDSPKKSKK
jgi:predicted transcriptional regulator